MHNLHKIVILEDVDIVLPACYTGLQKVQAAEVPAECIAKKDAELELKYEE